MATITLDSDFDELNQMRYNTIAELEGKEVADAIMNAKDGFELPIDED